jgi:hypothetical protein
MVKHPLPSAESHSAVKPRPRGPVEEGILCLAGLLVLFRITVWKLFPPCEVFVREDLSNILVAGLILVLVTAWLVNKIMRRGSFRNSGFEVPVLLFVGAAFGSLLYSVDFSSTLTGVLVLFAYIAFFFMLQDLLGEEGRARPFLIFLIACAAVVALFGIRDFVFLSQRPTLPTDQSFARANDSLYYILVNRRVTSFLGWPNTLAGYLMLFLPLTAACAITARERWLKAIFLSGFLIIAACFVLTFSFLGWLSFLAATAILFILSWKRLKFREWPKERKIAFLSLLVFFLAMFGWVIARKNFAGATAPRVQYYKAALALVKARPVLGHGWDAYQVASRKYAQSQAALTAYVHNSYLQAWVETGIVGLFGLLLLFVVFVRKSFFTLRRKEKGNASLLLGAVVWGLGAFFIDNLFSFTVLKPNVSLHFWVMLAVFVALCRASGGERQGTSGWPWLPLAWLATSLAVLFLLVRMILGFWSYQAGNQAFLRGDLAHAEQGLNRAQQWDPWQSRFRAGLGQVYLKAYFTTGQAGFFDRAEAQYWQAAKRSPSDYGNYFILSKLYERHGDKVKAEQLAKVAKSLSPYQYQHDLEVLAEMAQQGKLTSGGRP